MQTSPRRIARCLWGCIRSRSCVPFKSVYYTERDSHEITRCDSWGHEKEGPFATVDGIESPPPACPSLIRLTESSLSALKNGSGSGCETSRRSTYLTVSAGRNRQMDRTGIGSSQRAPLIQTPSPTPRRTLRQQSGPADSLPFRTGAPQQCEAMCTKGGLSMVLTAFDRTPSGQKPALPQRPRSGWRLSALCPGGACGSALQALRVSWQL